MIKTRQEQEANSVWMETAGLVEVLDKLSPGQLANRASLVYVLNKFKFGTVGTEIGVDMGDFSQVILDYMKPSKLYLIDPWKIYHDFAREMREFKEGAGFGEHVYTQEYHDKRYKYVKDRFKDNNIVQIMRGMSEERIKDIPNDTLDWAYVDGSHFEEYVYKDCVELWPKIKSGGVLCGHDFTFEGVPRALERFSREMNIIVWPYGSDWWINKE